MSNSRIHDILVKDVVTNPYQPRSFFDEESLKELANSIEKHGLLQPIVVRVNEEKKYELIAGERRLKAFQQLEKERIPAIVKTIDDQDSAILAMIENVQRDNLHFFEIASGYASLINEFNLTQNDLVEYVGKSQSTIANKLRLLKLDPNCMQLIMEHELSERHARALLKINNGKQQEKVLKYIVKNKLNVKETEKYIEKQIQPMNKDAKNQQQIVQKSFIKDLRLFTNTIRQAVDSIKNSGVDANYTVREDENKYTITIDIPIKKD